MGASTRRQNPAISPALLALDALIFWPGCAARRPALLARRAESRLSAKGAPPNSFPARSAAFSPSPGSSEDAWSTCETPAAARSGPARA
ncbi:MAG: hypothetical protein OXH76_04740 [Boseongicola sp.]|nr:hypothetical protein [Boseongicola sp.]